MVRAFVHLLHITNATIPYHLLFVYDPQTGREPKRGADCIYKCRHKVRLTT
jgi:hypothetical protein